MGSEVRSRLRSRLLKLGFVVASFGAAGAVAAGIVSGADQPSVTSDSASYAPGESVALSGAGWQAGEQVQLRVDDDQDDPWTHDAELTSADDGTISDTFDLPEISGEFTVTATALSGEATATFTVSAPTTPTPPAPEADPTLTSDEDAYTPGDAVTLSGADWRAGDTVQIAVDDDADDAWEHSAEATVEADGSFEHAFDLPSGLAAGFTATATDPTDRSATAEFSASFTAATQPYLVRFGSGTSSETQAQVLAAAGAVDVSFIAPLRIHGVLLPGGDGLQVSLDRLRSNPSVTRVEPDRTREAGTTPSDSAYGDQWSLPKIGWNNVFGELSPSGSARVAILDTGVDGSHPDLDGNVVPGTSILDGSNGLSDPNGHGTAMAGIVAAETNNGAGVAGVGFAGVQVMPVTVLDADGTGQDSDIIEGVVYAAENDADVILMAFSNPGYSELLQAAIDYAWEEGAVLVAATGNDGSSSVTFPAGDRGVIGVSNTDENDALSGSSNSGQAVFLGAPGTSITTTSAGGGTATISGTSASAAHVAGAAALLKAASGASNGVIVSRLARNAEPAGSRDQTGNGRLNLDRAVADTSTDSIQPAGADPLGGGGPIVGPYVAAAPSPQFDIAPSHVPAVGAHVFTTLVRNTTAPSSSDTARCVRITLPATVTVTSASFVVANPGTGAGQTGNWTLTSGANFVQVRNNESGSGARGLAGTSATADNWVRFEITTNATATGTSTWTARMHQTGTSDCASGGSTDSLGVRVGGSFTRDYTADFRDASNNVIPAPTATAGSTQAYRIRITRTAGGDDLSYAFVALPTCLTAITGISTTNSTSGGTPDFVASLTDNAFRFVTSGDKLSANGQWTQVHFTATASCGLGAHVFRTASWKNTSPETSEGDIFKLQTGTGHPTLTVVSANTPPVAVNDSYTTSEDTPLNVAAPGVLANDTDAQGNPLTAVLDSSPANAASFTFNANGSFSYTPDPDFSGTDSFTYHANDGTANGNTATVTITVTPVNDAPVAADDAATVAEDSGATSIDVLANDDDVDGDTLTVASVTDPADGTAVDNDTSVSYSPDPGFCGTDTFDYTVSDGNGGSDTATVTVTVTCVNDAPNAVNDAATVAEDSGATAVDVLGNDTDADGDTLIVSSVTDPANGTATDNDSDVSYTPDADFCGTDTFDYSISDGNGGSDTATVTVTVTCVNDAPVAVDDAYLGTEDTQLSVAAPGVLGNDTDPDDPSLTAELVGDVSDGTLALAADGSFTYDPDANFCGADSFTYRADDGEDESNVATVSITVACVNDAPDAADDAATVAEDSGATTIDVLANDSDDDGNALVVSSVTDPANGTASDNDSNVSYTPDANFCGEDTFDYTVSDGNGGTDTATVTVTVTCVNDTPVADDDAATVAEDSGSTPIAVLANDDDADGDTLVVDSVTDPANGTATDGDTNVSYTPDANFCGEDTFDYTVTDGNGGTDTATVTVTVTCVNDAPVAVDDAYPATEDTQLVVSAPGVLGNDTDVDDTALTAVLFGDVSNGTLALAADGSFTYDPDPNYCGADSFTYRADDGDAQSNLATVSIAIACVNDAPVAVDDAYPATEDTLLTVTAPGVLGNDTDAEGSTLTAALVGDVSDGTLALAADGSFTYDPDANFCGADSFTYRANDGDDDSNVATVSITVACVNDAPVAGDDAATVAEDSGATAIDVLANDDDVEGDPLVVTAVTNPANGSAVNNGTSVSYTPDADYCGADSFDYTVSDGNGGSDTATVSITVTCVNDTPVANDDSYNATEDTALSVAAPGVLGNDTDVDAGETLTAALVSGPAHDAAFTLNANGSFDYTPDPNYCGPDSFTYRANDGEADSNVATVSLTVACVNDAPVASDDSYAATEDTPLTVAAPGVLGNDTDADTAETLTAVLVSGPSHEASFMLNADGSFSYTPDPNYCGPDSFTYRANDGEADSAIATVSLTVACVNDAPVANDDSYNATEDTALSVNAATGVLANDTDPDAGETLTAVLVTGPAHEASFTLNANGSFDYTPDPNYCGPDSFTYRANDGEADSNVATVSLTVTCVNDAPTAGPDAATVAEDSGATAIDVLANDNDVDGDTLTITSASNPPNGTVVITGGGTGLTYEPDANYCGADSFTYTVSDGNGGSDTATVSITVTCVNDVPVADAGGPYSGNEAATVQLDGSGSDDVEGPVTYSWTITPQTGSANDPGPGATCSFVDGTTASSEKPKVSCTDDGIYDVALTVTDSNGVTDGDTTTLTLANVAPTVAKPTFDPTLLGCQTATTLKNISFSDPGTVDHPWTVSIDWGDGSLDTTYTTTTQGAQPNQTHVYATADTYTATVTVTDKDLDSGSNTSSTTATVFPYTVEFRPPVDGSTPTNTVVNKMKNGRVVPVKVRIRDLCGGTDMLDPSAEVTIKVTKVSGTSGVGDPVEEYADAGNSSGGTNLFRHGGDHWIYNLDSKALGLVVNNRYRVDVYVNNVRATVTSWAILEPVK